MQKLCCIPFNETPEINVRLNCVSTCCTSNDMKRKASVKMKDVFDGSNVKGGKKSYDNDKEEDIVMKTCCCVFARKSTHANVLPVDDIPTNGSQSEGDLL